APSDGTVRTGSVTQHVRRTVEAFGTCPAVGRGWTTGQPGEKFRHIRWRPPTRPCALGTRHYTPSSRRSAGTGGSVCSVCERTTTRSGPNMNASAGGSEPGLTRVLGRGDVLAVAFGAMIGFGWVVK